MTWLDVFALIVLLVLAATGIAVWVLMGMYPGKIARERKHPQAEAIAVCGWWRDDESACRDGDSSGGAKL